MKATGVEEEEAMQIVINQNRPEAPSRPEASPAQARILLWACAGLLDTLCLLAGMYWIMIADDPRPLALRVSLVAALAVVSGVGTLLAYLRLDRKQ